MNKIIEYSTHLKEIIDEHLYKILIGLLLGCFSMGLFLVVALSKQNDNNIVQNDTATIDNTNVDSSDIESTNSNKQIYIDVKGEVNNPGVYKMKAGSRVTDLIRNAGGFKKDADQTAVNLAKQLADQDMIVVYKVGQGPKANQTDDVEKEKVNINKADSDELQKLDRVGEKMAQKIIDYRNQHNGFHSIDEIKQISGFGEKTFERLKDSLTI